MSPELSFSWEIREQFVRVKKHIQHCGLSKSSAIPLTSLAMQIIQMQIPGCSLIHNSSKYLHPLSSYFGWKYAKRIHRRCLSVLQFLHFGQQKWDPVGVTAESILQSHLSGKIQTSTINPDFSNLQVEGYTHRYDLGLCLTQIHK